MRLRYDSRAVADLDEIFSYIAQENHDAAKRVVGRIRLLSEQLTRSPRVGRMTDVPALFVRSVVTYPYVIFFTIAAEEIVVLHVRHTSRRAPDPSEVI
jgi:toxin ParE1/3/4